MVSIISRIADRVARFLFPRQFEPIQMPPSEEEKEIEQEEIREGIQFRQKLVSALYYCNGEREELFARTFEDNEKDRAMILMRDIQEFAEEKSCSEIRENFGYSDDFVPELEVDTNFIYPNVEVGKR